MRSFSIIAVSMLTGEIQSQVVKGPARSEPAIAPTGLAVAPSGFEENKGQVLTAAGDPAPFVRYRLTQGNTSIFLLDNGIAYQFNQSHYPEGYATLTRETHLDAAKQQELDALRKEVRLETYRMDMLLEGANANARITTEGRSEDYTQYYNHDALDVHTYTRVTYHEVYPGIDWVIYTTEKGMKYDFMVKPGTDPAQIKLRFKDHEELYVNAEGQLIHGNRMGRFTEAQPISFQSGKEVHTRFLLEGNRLSFALGAYDPSQQITIDPARIWGTYYGGTGNDSGQSCVVDVNGNVYLAGDTESNTSIASNGHQNTIGGNTDAYLVKFSGAGVRQWGTYYGGTGTDIGASCVVDGGNVYLAGYTNSNTGIASGGHQNTRGGGYDAFLVKFDASGVRQWGTYYGGIGTDFGMSCVADASGSAYLAGQTNSSTAIAFGGHQNGIGGSGIDDAFLVKFNSSGVRQWGTYYGGTDYDWGTSCTTDVNGDVYLVGTTISTTNIASGGHQNTFGGAEDAFLVKFNANGLRQWGSYYGGALNYESGKSCAVDNSGNVYLAGNTTGGTGIASGGHQNTYGGGMYDAYLVKFTANGVRQWGTFYGGNDYDTGQSCAVDGGGTVYLAGVTGSGIAISSDGYQDTYGGGVNDAFLVQFNTSGVRQWGSYYGGAGNDGGRWCAVDASSTVYLAGYTESITDIASVGHQNSHGGAMDAFLVKFDAGLTPGCSYSLTPTSNPTVPSTGAINLMVSVFADIGCAWTAVSNDPAMITIVSGSPGNGDGTVSYDVSSNPGSSARVGSFSVQGIVFQVTQEGSSGCAYSFNPANNPSVPSDGAANLSVNINTDTGCTWTAMNNTPAMITIVSGSSGIGSGLLTYNVSSNPGPTTRSGSISVEGVTFEIMQVGNTSFVYSVTASAQPENGTYPSAIPLSTQPHLKICTDGSRATILMVTANDASTNMSVIRMRMKHGNGDSGFSGVFEMGYDTTETTTTTRFTHPTYVITAPGASYRNDTLEVYSESAPLTVLASVPVRFYRSPIAFIHGFGGSAATFQPMANNLVSTGMYPPSFDLTGGSPLLYRAGYGARSLLPLSMNRREVPKAIKRSLTNAIAAGYSCGKATVIAHSMGGLLSRNYLGSYDGELYLGDISRLITVSTPHYGTQLANYCTPTFPLQAPNECSEVYGAIGLLPLGYTIGSVGTLVGALVSLSAARDMKVDADPILRLNTSPQLATVPSVTLATDETGDPNGLADFVRTRLSGALDPDDENIYDSEEHDLVVPMSSQQSGMQLQGIVQQQWHIGSSANGSIQSQVRTLLDLDPSSPAFSQTGFVQNTLVYSLPAGTVNELSAGGSRSTGELSIISPTQGEVFAPNETVSVDLEYSGEVTSMSMSVLGNGFDPIVIESASVSQLQFQVPSNAVGNVGIYVLGGDGVGWVASDATFITVMSPVVPDSIRATPGALEIPLGVSDYVAVEGYYGNGSPIDLIDAPGMTMAMNPDFLEYNGQGEFRALALGQTYVAFNYFGALDTTYFTIVDDPAALVAAFDYSDPVICAGGSVAFTDASLGMVTAYQWRFEGGEPLISSDPAPTVTYTLPGNYPVKLVTSFINGVDSLELVGLVVVQEALDVTVVDGGSSLTASVDNAFYQWLDCMNGHEAIVGAIAQDFAPAANGLYAVRVIAGACTDTSDCFTFIGTGLEPISADGGFRIMPNPNDGRFTVLLPHLEGQVRFVVTDVAGQVMWSETASGVRRWAFELNGSPGLYFMDIYSEHGRKTLKLLKQ